ncbi:GNAT family N-acetyltransferase [Rothia endophytica]|uniref:GNAT family N-acetyltransferase n=1 Tax=Rothia endophytica TaxID=1324766 RepID=UPI001F00BC85|nr:DUF4081 domain-containing GNAT family N-acetyltransferase [Rothia endophytica]
MSVLSKIQRNAADAIIRPLTLDDRDELEALISTDPVGFLYAAEHLSIFGLPAPSTLNALKAPHGFIGVFAPRHAATAEGSPKDAAPPEPAVAGRLPRRVLNVLEGMFARTTEASGRTQGSHSDASLPGYAETVTPDNREPRYALVGALWLGANCVPLAIPAEYERQVAQYVLRHHRRIGSIFGRREAVMGLWEYLSQRMPAPFDVREDQPLLELPEHVDLTELAGGELYRPNLKAPQITEKVRWARTSDRQSLLRASVAMFTEEVGYDPMTRDPAGYTRRIDDLTRSGRTLVAVNAEGVVVFKTDLGLAHGDACQLQGVWLHPAYRGRGLAPTLLAQASELIRTRFPQLSLYVNSYNTVARALYQRTGWEQTGTFSTILF